MIDESEIKEKIDLVANEARRQRIRQDYLIELGLWAEKHAIPAVHVGAGIEWKDYNLVRNKPFSKALAALPTGSPKESTAHIGGCV